MDASHIQQILLAQLGWRVGPNAARYVQARLEAGEAEPFAVIAADARTGRPLRALLDPKFLKLDTPAQS